MFSIFKNKEQEAYSSSKWLLILLSVFVAILFIPLLLTSFSIIDFTETGEIGDTIGGITAPFIGFLSAYLVYKAFEEQRRANNYQLRLIKAQLHDREFTIFFKLIEDLQSLSKSQIKSNNQPYEMEHFCFQVNQGNILLEKNNLPQWLIVFEQFIDQFIFTLDFINHSNCDSLDKQFFKNKIRVDFDRIIQALCNFSYQKALIRDTDEFVLVEPIFDKLDCLVKFREEIIRDEESSYKY